MNSLLSFGFSGLPQVGYSIRFEDCTSERTCVKVSDEEDGRGGSVTNGLSLSL